MQLQKNKMSQVVLQLFFEKGILHGEMQMQRVLQHQQAQGAARSHYQTNHREKPPLIHQQVQNHRGEEQEIKFAGMQLPKNEVPEELL